MFNWALSTVSFQAVSRGPCGGLGGEGGKGARGMSSHLSFCFIKFPAACCGIGSVVIQERFSLDTHFLIRPRQYIQIDRVYSFLFGIDKYWG